MKAFRPEALARLARIFVTGTDTGVGKTFVAARLASALAASGRRTAALKPVCCGARTDPEILREAASNHLSLDEINPLWLPLPLAPAVAAGPHPVNFDSLVAWFRALAPDWEALVVEGAGGWLVPLAPGKTMADLAAAFGLPVVIVVANRLGCLNHALLTAESVRAKGLPCVGFILNACPTAPDDISPATNRAALEEASGLPVLAEFGWEGGS